MNKFIKKRKMFIFLLLLVLIFIADRPFSSLAGSSSRVHLKIGSVEYSEDKETFTVQGSVSNFSSETIPVCSMVFNFPAKTKAGLDLKNAELWKWTDATPADADISGNEKRIQITLSEIEPGESFSFSFSGLADIPETKRKETIHTGIGAMIDLQDNGEQDGNREAESVIPLHFDTVMHVEPEPETESIPEKTEKPKEPEKQLIMSERKQGSEKSGSGRDIMIGASGVDSGADAGYQTGSAANTGMQTKNFVLRFTLIMAACLIAACLIAKHIVRRICEGRRKFRPGWKLQGENMNAGKDRKSTPE